MRIEGSYGNIYIDDEGYPLTPLPEEYSDIAKFDIPRLERMCAANHISVHRDWDIVAVAYWTHDGEYEQPAPDYSENGLMMHIWTGRVDNYEDACALDDEEESVL